jgi:5-methylcytosine-specific restriction endonuclease McrA
VKAGSHACLRPDVGAARSRSTSIPTLRAKGNWRRLIDWLIEAGFVSAKEIGALVLGHLNPSQVGTSIASKPSFQAHYPRRKTMQAVLAWHIDQIGKCADCGSRLELQADHIDSREKYGDAADRLENMTLRCRRCNVIRRPEEVCARQRSGLWTRRRGNTWLLADRRHRYCDCAGDPVPTALIHAALATEARR